MPRNPIISVACAESMMLVSVQGLGSMNNSNAIYDFVSQGATNGIKDVCIDLGECDGMDSTFMGTLLLIHEDAILRHGDLFIINLSDKNRGNLDELGLTEFLHISNSIELPKVEFKELCPESAKNERMNLILRAHEELAQRNDENKDRFGVFIKALKQSI